MTHDGISRCECCDMVVPHDRLICVVGVNPYPAIPAMLCRGCESALNGLEKMCIRDSHRAIRRI